MWLVMTTVRTHGSWSLRPGATVFELWCTAGEHSTRPHPNRVHGQAILAQSHRCCCRYLPSRGQYFEMWWPGTELNRRRQPFQGCALPPELPGHILSRHPLLLRTARLVRFTPIVAGLPTGKQQNADCVRNVVDYSKARSGHGYDAACDFYIEPLMWTPRTNAWHEWASRSLAPSH